MWSQRRVPHAHNSSLLLPKLPSTKRMRIRAAIDVISCPASNSKQVCSKDSCKGCSPGPSLVLQPCTSPDLNKLSCKANGLMQTAEYKAPFTKASQCRSCGTMYMGVPGPLPATVSPLAAELWVYLELHQPCVQRANAGMVCLQASHSQFKLRS
jgi:hypothetical protein